MTIESIKDLSDWNAQLLRITTFLSEKITEQPAELWTQVVGEQPESVTAHPKQGVTIVSGSYSDGMLEMHFQLGRIDWMYAINPVEGVANPTGLYLEDYKAQSERFSSDINKWLKTFQVSIFRMAYGGTLFLNVDDRTAGYEVLQQYLPSVTLDPANSSDFSYQINRPISSSVADGVKLNRLSKWSVVIVRGFNLSADSIGEKAIKQPIGDEFHACRLEFDVNSALECKDIFPMDKKEDLWNEFISVANSIVLRGDVV